MADTTRRILLWIIVTVIGILVIDLMGIFFMVHFPDWVHTYSNRMN